MIYRHQKGLCNAYIYTVQISLYEKETLNRFNLNLYKNCNKLNSNEQFNNENKEFAYVKKLNEKNKS